MRPNFYLSRAEISTLIYALREYEDVSRKSAAAAARYERGAEASYAVAASDAQELRKRFTAYAADQGWLNAKPEAVKP